MLLAHVLDPLRRSIGGTHANSGEASFQPTLGPVSPTHILPLGFGQHVFGRPRQDIWNVPLAGTAPTGNRPDQFNPDWIHLKVTRDTNGPSQAACREPLTERRAEAVTGIRQHTAKAHTGCHHAIDCKSAWAPDADRHDKSLNPLAFAGSNLCAYSQTGRRDLR